MKIKSIFWKHKNLYEALQVDYKERGWHENDANFDRTCEGFEKFLESAEGKKAVAEKYELKFKFNETTSIELFVSVHIVYCEYLFLLMEEQAEHEVNTEKTEQKINNIKEMFLQIKEAEKLKVKILGVVGKTGWKKIGDETPFSLLHKIPPSVWLYSETESGDVVCGVPMEPGDTKYYIVVESLPPCPIQLPKVRFDGKFLISIPAESKLMKIDSVQKLLT